MLHLHNGVGFGRFSNNLPMLLDSDASVAGDSAAESCIANEVGDWTDSTDG